MQLDDIRALLDRPGQAGVLSTANLRGEVNAAVFGSATITEQGELVLALGENRSLGNLRENPLATFTVGIPGPHPLAWEGGRLYLKATGIETDGPLLARMREQIRLAAGEKLGRKQSDIVFRGHAIEARINAENPDTFAPSPGVITGYHAPGGFGIRVDTGIYERYRVLPFYDSLIAKLVVYGEDRDRALRRMERALGEFVVEGISTNIPFHRRILQHPGFRKGEYDTRLVEQILTPPVED